MNKLNEREVSLNVKHNIMIIPTSLVTFNVFINRRNCSNPTINTKQRKTSDINKQYI